MYTENLAMAIYEVYLCLPLKLMLYKGIKWLFIPLGDD